jgi:integrase
MASIRRREHKSGGGVTYAVLFNLDGKQTSVPWETAQDAEEFRLLVQAVGGRRAMEIEDIPLPKTAAPKTDKITVEQWLTRHIDQLTGVEQGTIDKYRSYLKNDIAPVIGSIPLEKLTEEDIAAWVKHLETAKGSHKTIKNKHGFLSGALAAAVPRHIPANPAAGRRLPRGKGDDVEVTDRMLSRDEFDRLYEAVTDHWKPLIMFLVWSGCRWGEAAALRPEDVDRAKQAVRIRRAWKYSSAGYETGRPKTTRSVRTIVLPSAVLDQLTYDNEWLFVNRTGGPVRYAGFKRRVWDPAVKRAKLNPPPTPHSLRHTCASWLLSEGYPIIAVSRHLGHQSVKMTADVYGGVDKSVAEEMARGMEQLMARPPQLALEAPKDSET